MKKERLFLDETEVIFPRANEVTVGSMRFSLTEAPLAPVPEKGSEAVDNLIEFLHLVTKGRVTPDGSRTEASSALLCIVSDRKGPFTQRVIRLLHKQLFQGMFAYDFRTTRIDRERIRCEMEVSPAKTKN